MSKGKNQAPSGAIKHNTYTGKELTGYLVGLAGQNIIYNIIAGGLQYYWQSIIFFAGDGHLGNILRRPRLGCYQ